MLSFVYKIAISRPSSLLGLIIRYSLTIINDYKEHGASGEQLFVYSYQKSIRNIWFTIDPIILTYSNIQNIILKSYKRICSIYISFAIMYVAQIQSYPNRFSEFAMGKLLFCHYVVLKDFYHWWHWKNWNIMI